MIRDLGRKRKMLNYHELSKELQKEIIRDRQVGWKNPYACTQK